MADWPQQRVEREGRAADGDGEVAVFRHAHGRRRHAGVEAEAGQAVDGGVEEMGAAQHDGVGIERRPGVLQQHAERVAGGGEGLAGALGARLVEVRGQARAVDLAALQPPRGEARYAGWDGDVGSKLLAPATSLDDAAAHALQRNVDERPVSGRQEAWENLFNEFVG